MNIWKDWNNYIKEYWIVQEKIILSPESLPQINAKLAAIEKLIKEGKQSPEVIKQLQEYYNY